MAEQDNTQEVMTLDAYLDSKAAHMDKAAIADVARGILSGDIDAVVKIEREPYAGHDLASLLRHATMPTEYGRAAIWKRKELLDMKLGRDFDSSVLGAIMIRMKAEAPAMPEPTEPEINRAWAHLIDSPNPKASALYKQDANRIRESLTAEEKRAWAREALVRNEGNKTKAGLEMGVGESCIRGYLKPKK